MDNTNDSNTPVSCSPQDCESCSGCGSVPRMDEAHQTITLTLDDDSEICCQILTIFAVQEHDYIALLPLDESGENTTGEVYLYRFTQTPGGDPMLSNIEDDAEYEAVAQAFETVCTRIMEGDEQ